MIMMMEMISGTTASKESLAFLSSTFASSHTQGVHSFQPHPIAILFTLFILLIFSILFNPLLTPSSSIEDYE